MSISNNIYKIFTGFTLVALGVMSLGLITTTSVLADTAPQDGISILPTDKDVTNTLTKRWFIEKIEPGKSVERSADIINLSNTDKTIKITARDRITTPEGNFTFTDENQQLKGVGAWLKIDQDTVTVPAQKQVSVKFTINVPSDQKAGEFAGVIAVQEIKKDPGQNGFNLVSVIGSRIYVTVPGDLKTGVEFSKFNFITPQADGYATYIQKTVATDSNNIFMSWKFNNSGNIFTKLKGKLEITAPSGTTSADRDFDLAPFDDSVSIPFLSLPGKWEVGKYHAKFTFDTAPVISNNKDKVSDISSKKVIETDADMTQAMIDQMKTDKDKAKLSNPAADAANNAKPNNASFAIKNDLPDAKAEEKTKNDNMLLYGLGGVIIVLLLAIVGYFGYKEYNKRKNKTPEVMPVSTKPTPTPKNDKPAK